MVGPALCFKARTAGIATSSRGSYEPARAVAQRKQKLSPVAPPSARVGKSASQLRRKSEVQAMAGSLPQLFETFEGITVLDFHRENCGPCKILGEEVERVGALFNADQLNILKVDTDVEEKMASAYRVQGLPTLVFLRNGQEVYRIKGLNQNILANLGKVFKWYVNGLDRTLGAL